MTRVTSPETSALARIADRRFRNFSEATDLILSALGEVIPGVILLGRFEPDEQVCRIIDVRGGGVEGLVRGGVLPVETDRVANGSQPVDSSGAGTANETGLDLEFLASLGARSWWARPLEMSDGIIAGALCALESEPGAYRPEHAALLGVAAALLGHEWESVQRRAELRRLRVRLSQGPSTDLDTGLVNRDAFLALIDREWRLTARGTIESVLVACAVDVDTGEEENESNGAVRNVALKVAADVLSASIRATDHAGRVGPMAVAAILVGCRTDEAPVFVERLQAALRRVTAGQSKVTVTCSIHSLSGAPPPEELLKVAERAAGEQGRSSSLHGMVQEAAQ
jgi:diguanylate cyclase (GGDEF)-like protein